MPTPNIRSAAELLLEARTSGQPLETLPAALMPATIEEAYAIQDRVTAALGPIGGWKTAPANNGVRFNWAPIPATGIFPDAAEIALSAFPRSALELEIGFLVRRDLPPQQAPYGRDAVADALGDMRVCLELFASRYADRAARSPLEQLADGQNAAGIIVGTGVAHWQELDLGNTALALDYADATHRRTGGRGLDDLIEACVDLANGTGRLGGLRAGQVIITGARIGPIAASAAGPVRARIDPVGTVTAILR